MRSPQMIVQQLRFLVAAFHPQGAEMFRFDRKAEQNSRRERCGSLASLEFTFPELRLNAPDLGCRVVRFDPDHRSSAMGAHVLPYSVGPPLRETRSNRRKASPAGRGDPPMRRALLNLIALLGALVTRTPDANPDRVWSEISPGFSVGREPELPVSALAVRNRRAELAGSSRAWAAHRVRRFCL